MDTKLKNNNSSPEDAALSGQKNKTISKSIFKYALVLFVAIALTASLLSASFIAARYISETENTYFESGQLNQESVHGACVLYWQLQNSQHGTSASELFLGDAFKESGTQREEAVKQIGESNLEIISRNINNNIASRYEATLEEWKSWNYVAMDTKTGNTTGKSDDALNKVLNEAKLGSISSKTKEMMKQKYLYYNIIAFNDKGSLSLSLSNGYESLTQQEKQNWIWDFIISLMIQGNGSLLQIETNPPQYDSNGTLVMKDVSVAEFPWIISSPKNFVCVTAVLKDGPMPQSFQTQMFYNQQFSFSSPFYYLAHTACLLAALLFAIICGLAGKKSMLNIKLAQLPLEFSVIITVLSVIFAEVFSYGIFMVIKGFSLVNEIFNIPESFFGSYAFTLDMAIISACLTIMFAAFIFAWLSIMQVFKNGPKHYLTKQSITGYILVFAAGLLRRGAACAKALFDKITSIDLQDDTNKFLFKMLGLNCIIICVLGSLWLIGIPLMIAYSVFLFLHFRKKLNLMKSQYETLLSATNEMAGGNLDISIQQDMGVLTPYKNGLEKIKDGFVSAVEAETKSQSMKTELITNVSHDLKTPLTAIITYIGLLQKEDITEEERQSYIETLDLKSQRLKRLIEDLFEMSKAASKDITLNFSKVDIVALIKQVVMEEQESLESSGIEVIYKVPEEKTYLTLDGGKTSRIFENLIQNIAKYSMAGTRAYIHVIREPEALRVEIKSTSREPLEFDSQQITERFVRGDLSRSSEGYGLGLSIAKNFAEVQNAAFSIETDGDLFKAVILFSDK